MDALVGAVADVVIVTYVITNAFVDVADDNVVSVVDAVVAYFVVVIADFLMLSIFLLLLVMLLLLI